jgi:hypothetical protein
MMIISAEQRVVAFVTTVLVAQGRCACPRNSRGLSAEMLTEMVADIPLSTHDEHGRFLMSEDHKRKGQYKIRVRWWKTKDESRTYRI